MWSQLWSTGIYETQNTHTLIMKAFSNTAGLYADWYANGI